MSADLPVLLLTETLTRHRIRRAAQYLTAFLGALALAVLFLAVWVATP